MLTRFYRPLVCVQLTILLLALSAPSADAGDWPQWRGPNRNGQATSTGLLKKWPAEGPAVRWQVDRVGVGYSSISIVGNRIYTQGDLNGVEHVICLDTKDGSVVWAVQPGPLATLLANRLAKELQRLDTDKNGIINELEALKGFGWKFNDYDYDTNEKSLVANIKIATGFITDITTAKLITDYNIKCFVSSCAFVALQRHQH